MTNNDLSEMSFEAAYEELTRIVAALEGESLALEESVSLYERGRELSLYCEQLLENAELRISQLNEDGTTAAM